MSRAWRAMTLGIAVAAMCFVAPAGAKKGRSCETKCTERIQACRDSCDEYAGTGAGRCKAACDQMEDKCLKSCRKREKGL